MSCADNQNFCNNLSLPNKSLAFQQNMSVFFLHRYPGTHTGMYIMIVFLCFVMFQDITALWFNLFNHSSTDGLLPASFLSQTCYIEPLYTNPNAEALKFSAKYSWLYSLLLPQWMFLSPLFIPVLAHCECGNFVVSPRVHHLFFLSVLYLVRLRNLLPGLFKLSFFMIHFCTETFTPYNKIMDFYLRGHR